ncbi:hypothetical protein PGTUg99_031181 [Puccinia graminis f. sp. tritici]|uniref:Uncharacterized protein n=1 Tax=Puccinia graminis f. sp. tritici TaxID=56615 RepID=A0A5B0RGT6_PUCGR|nr:hypothetical protein PGTUg99_031181 [Puccinia graminis f. sp. tritici]
MVKKVERDKRKEEVAVADEGDLGGESTICICCDDESSVRLDGSGLRSVFAVRNCKPPGTGVQSTPMRSISHSQWEAYELSLLGISLLTLRLANFTDSFGSTRQKHLSNISASVVALTKTSVESTADSAQ